MNISELISAINEVLQANSEQELVSVLNLHPELLEQETLMEIMSMLEQDKQNGRDESAQALEIALNRIAFVIQNQTEATQTEPLPKIEPKVAWAIKARRHIALQKPELLEEAIAEANQSPEIVEFLRAFQQNDIEKIDQLIEQLYSQLQQASRKEESSTVYLIYLHPRARLAESFYQYPFDQQRQVREAGIQASQQAAQIAETLQDKACQAIYLGALASGFRRSRQLREAEYFQFQSLEIYRKLAKSEPHIFLQYVAMTLNNLGTVQSDQRKLQEAENSFLEVLEIERKLAESEPHIFLQNVATTLNNLGIIQKDQRKLREAENTLIEALEIKRKLAESEPDIFLQSIAMTLNNLGITQNEQRKLREAENSLIEGLELYRELAKREPHIFLPPVAMTLENLGIAQMKKKRLREAENSFLEALEIRRTLAKSEPHIFLQYVAMTLNNLGTTQNEQRKLREAENSYSEALEIYQKLAESEPHIFLQNVAMILSNLGSAQRMQRKLREAENSYSEALEIYRKLAESEPQIFLQNVATTLNNLGNAQSEQRKLREAEISYLEALEIRRKLAESEPQIFLQKMAMTLNNLGIIQSEQRKFGEAENYLIEGLEIYRKLAESEPHIFLQEVATTLHNLGATQSEQRKLQKAENSYSEALEIYRKLAKNEPHIFLQNVAITLNNIGYIDFESDAKKAEAKFAEAKEIVEQLRAKAVTIDDKTRILQENVSVYNGLLTCYLKQQNWEKVLEIAELGKSRSLTDLLNLKSEDLQPKSPTPDTLAIVRELGKRYSDAIKELQRLESLERYLSQELNRNDNYRKQIADDSSNDEDTQLGWLNELETEKRSFTQQQKEAQQQRFATEAELKTVLAEINEKYDPDFPPTAQDIRLEKIKSIANEQQRTIVMFRVLRETTAIIFVFPTGELHVEEIPNFGQNELADLFVQKWLIPYKESERTTAENFLPAFENWKKMMLETLAEIDEKIMFKVREVLKNKSTVTDILLIPNQSLALLPLHAACRKENGAVRYFLEDYNVSFCPSVSVFNRCLQNEKTRNEKTLGIITPSKNIFEFETEQIEMLEDFNPSYQKLSKTEATIEKVNAALQEDYGFIHFYCHGKFVEGNPFDSGLEMADDVLKMPHIINQNLRENWLTVLSACETGMVDAASATDEHLGLPLAFVFAGSPSIWASLWSVSAITTSDLMIKAYGNLKTEKYMNNKSEALRQAQIEMSTDKDYSHPVFWAGFQHFGK